MGFLISLLLWVAGFTIYCILSFKARLLQFGVFRAMGLPKRAVVGMVSFEHILITGTAGILGIVIGELASYLFVPMIGILHSSAEQVIPFIVTAYPADYLRLYATTGAALAAGILILIALISRLRIASTLKLGEE